MWEIEETEVGFDVRQDGRAVAYDEEELGDAVEVVRRHGGTSYVLIEADGYRTTHPV